VILESGLGADHASWARVAPDAAVYARVCSYDRAGLGQSDSGPAPRDAAAASADLTALLAAAGVPGPYILVGHSFGGLLVRHFAAANPDSVVGLVLADAVSEEWWTRAAAALPPESAEESERLRGFRRFLSVDIADPARNAEGLDIRTVAAQVRAAPPLGAKPLVVLVAAIPDVLAPGLPPAVERELVALLQDELPRAMAASSADSTVIVVPESGHNIPQQRPDMIVLAIQAVLAAVAQ
jgi:pimeloyl-ACP methyl ester carboxylesterase